MMEKNGMIGAQTPGCRCNPGGKCGERSKEASVSDVPASEIERLDADTLKAVAARASEVFSRVESNDSEGGE